MSYDFKYKLVASDGTLNRGLVCVAHLRWTIKIQTSTRKKMCDCRRIQIPEESDTVAASGIKYEKMRHLLLVVGFKHVYSYKYNSL